MLRRTLLQRLAGMFAASPFVHLRVLAQSGPFSLPQQRTLAELAALVLPSALGQEGAEKIATNFQRYVREYRPGADTDHGYGFTHVRPKPPSPAAIYAEQLSALPNPVTRAAIEQVLQKMESKELPRVPAGKSVIIDLMAFYFRSSEANDLCYLAAIGRDECRGLHGSDRVPAPIRRSA